MVKAIVAVPWTSAISSHVIVMVVLVSCATAKANGLEPYHYLKYLMTELPYYQRDDRDIEPLLPWNVEGEDIVRLA